MILVHLRDHAVKTHLGELVVDATVSADPDREFVSVHLTRIHKDGQPFINRALVVGKPLRRRIHEELFQRALPTIKEELARLNRMEDVECLTY